MARPTLRKIRLEMAKIDPEVLAYLKLALPYVEMSKGVALPMQAEAGQLYVAEALSSVDPKGSCF